MDTIYNISLNKSSSTPLYLQLAGAISAIIQKGDIRPHSQLPSVRKLAKSLGVNNATVVAAYKFLESNKQLYSNVGRGTFALGITNKKSEQPDFDLKSAINFAKETIDSDLFPIEAIKDAFSKVLDNERGSAFAYSETPGLLPLRTQISADLLNYAIQAKADNVWLIPDITTGVDIVSEALLSVSDTVLMEAPASYSIGGVFQEKGARIITVPMQRDGLDLDKLEAVLKTSPVKFICASSYIQTPTGYSYSPEKKQKLIELACHYDTYIVERDTHSEFILDNTIPKPIKAFDNKGRVIYIKSYGRSSLPGFSITALVASDCVLSLCNKEKAVVSGFIARAFERFMAAGHYHKHIKEMAQIMKARFSLVECAIFEKLSSYVEYTPNLGGTGVWLKLIDESLTSQKLASVLLKEKVVIIPGALYHMQNIDIPYFRLSFAAVDEAAIRLGIDKIAELLKK